MDVPHNAICSRMQVADPIMKITTIGFRHGYFSHRSCQCNSTNEAKPSRETAQVLVLKKAMDIQATGALALLQALPLATKGDLGNQVNTMA